MPQRETLSRRAMLLAGAGVGATALAAAPENDEKGSNDPPKAGAHQKSRKTYNEEKAPQGRGAITWSIIGPQKVVGRPACPEFPEYYYQVAVSDSTDAKITHVIWNKQAPAGTGAIERVIIDNEGDYAEGKTPHFVDFENRVVIMSFCSFGVFELFATVIWQDTQTKANHLETKSIKIESIQKPDDP